ncbi:hypothetical protein H5T87_06550 [bacterium]|nr:hypothetical protein [bacterium]
MKAVTLRALLIGIGFSIFVNTCSPLTESRAFSNFSWSYLPEGAVIPFLFLLFLNLLLSRLSKRFSLTSGELLVIFVMVLVANSTPIFLIYMFLSAIASPLYFSSPENKWDKDLIPYMKKELILNDKLASKWFFEGLPEGERIPIHSWLTPLSHWLPFFFVVFLVSYIAIVLFRKYWMENEKLAYPLMQVPLYLVERGSASLFRRPLFWIGASIPFLIMAEQALHLYIPALPSLPVDHLGCLDWGWTPVRSQPLLCFNFLAFGVGFFVPTDVLCGIWFFYVLTLFEEALFHKFSIATGSGGMFVWGNAAIAWQSLGAFLLFTLSTIYLARRHIFNLLLTTFRKNYHEDELLPPRIILPLFLICFAYLIYFLNWSGMPILVAFLFLVFLLLIYIGLARIVCQSGIFYIVPPVIAQNICIFALGSRNIGKEGMVALGLSYSWHGDTQDVFCVFASEGARLWDSGKAKGWHFSLALFISAIVGLLVAPSFIIYTGYQKGTLTWNTWIFKGWGPSTYEQVLGQIRNPFGFKSDYFLWAMVGAILMLIFNYLHLRFVWWPIHPIGLAIASSFTLYAVYLGAFLAWLVKIAILRWGGLRTFNKATPFFLGLIVGHYLGRTISLILYSTLGIWMM